MSLTFCNRYSFTPGYDIYLAYMWYDPSNCSGDGFNTIGWYGIPPGRCVTVYNGDVNFNTNWAYYAECPKDGGTWSGDIQGWVSNEAFRLCHGDACTPCRVVGFRLFSVNNDPDVTIPLTA
jgi:uncharacterized membrane protein